MFYDRTDRGQESGTADDLPYARAVARHLGLPLEVVTVDAVRMAEGLERMVAQLDEPLSDPAPFNVLQISRAARERGIKVLLAERGATICSRATAGTLRSGSTAGCVCCRARSVAVWNWRPPVSISARHSFGARRDYFAARSSTETIASSTISSGSAREELHRLYTDEVRAALDGAQAVRPLLDFLEPLPESVEPLERMLALEQRFFLADHNLLYMDKMSMAVGVELRVPLLAPSLVELAAAIPARFKQRGFQGKWILRRAMAQDLPREILFRPKTGFGAPVRRWLKRELRPLLEDILSPASLRRRGLFDPKAVQSLLQANEDGRTDAAYTVLALLYVELWCREYLDAQAVSAPAFKH
ncbi:MAG: asparagine synthase C-terminal domain-containing protein [Burkholderiales bacterium]|nr:asparagine synthase C-terminal domain-containing protein [Burkholderiales bacterium]